jgi:hypothetical protein
MSSFQTYQQYLTFFYTVLDQLDQRRQILDLLGFLEKIFIYLKTANNCGQVMMPSSLLVYLGNRIWF